MVELSSSCRCITAQADNGARLVNVLESIRRGCPVLHSVFLPKDTWPDFKVWHAKPDSIATHCSMLLLALKRGCLARLTSPVHRYLIENGDLHQKVRRQYVKDLRERWMLYEDPLERHKQSKIFTGRVTELQCADWLNARDWIITGLEALGDGPDIEAKDDSGRLTSFEIKFIGTEKDDFKMILNSLEKGSSARPGPSLSSSVNFLLFRIYEAAKQLAEFDRHRIAVIVIEDGAWAPFKIALENGWIDWTRPNFLDDGQAWIREQEKRYPNFMAEFTSVVGSIDKILILTRSHEYEYHLEYELPTGHSLTRDETVSALENKKGARHRRTGSSEIKKHTAVIT